MADDENDNRIDTTRSQSEQALNADEHVAAEETEEQKEQAEEWARNRMSTQPANKSEAEIGIKKLYAALGIAEPEIVWCGSPMLAGLVEAFLVMQGKIGPGTLRYEINKLIVQSESNLLLSRLDPSGDAVFKLEQFEDGVYRHIDVWEIELEDIMYGTAWEIANPGSDWNKLDSEVKAGLKEEANLAFRENTQFLGNRATIWCLSSKFARILPKDKDLEGLRMIAVSAGWIIPVKQVCLICERPTLIVFDESMQLHNDSGPAIEFSDGWKIYMWHGISVAAWIIEEPQAITVEQIEDECNIELRRVMIERYGASRYLADCGAIEVHLDQFGVLYRKETSDDVRDDELDEDDPDKKYDVPLLIVKVINATAEMDGSRKEYFLRVPPTMTTAREAVAWTFGLEADEYEPTQES